jgi:hypothetical protein
MRLSCCLGRLAGCLSSLLPSFKLLRLASSQRRATCYHPAVALFPLRAAMKEAGRRYASHFFGGELEVTICDFKLRHSFCKSRETEP